jgi:hypothetical protein
VAGSHEQRPQGECKLIMKFIIMKFMWQKVMNNDLQVSHSPIAGKIDEINEGFYIISYLTGECGLY